MRYASLLLVVLLVPGAAAAKKPQPGLPKPLGEIEAHAKALAKAKDAPAAFEGFMKWLGVPATCEANACKTISTTWMTANLDADGDEEKVLSIVTVGDGTCKPFALDVLVFDKFDQGWVAKDRTRLVHEGAAKPEAHVTLESVHDTKVKDLALRVDGKCAGGERAQTLRVESFAHGQLETLIDSSEYVGSGLISYSLGATSELADAKGKTKLLFDSLAFVYDTLPPYETALKSTTTKDDAVTLSTKECAAPLGGELAMACKLSGDAKVQVAVQNGKAVGLTITMTPEKASFARCMRKKVAAASWQSQPAVTGCVRTYSAK